MLGKSYFFMVVLMLAGLFACSPFRPEPVRLPENFVPETFSGPTTMSDPGSKWWIAFQNQELNDLIQEAFDNNFNLKTLWARVEQARASAIKAGAHLYPNLSTMAGVVYKRNQTSVRQGSEGSSKDYSMGLMGGYDPDLRGKNRAERQSALYVVEAGEYDYSHAAIVLAAEISRRWIQIISQRMQLKLLKDQLTNNEIFLELIQLRFRQAMVSILDIYQQQQIIDNIEAQIPLVKARERRLANEMALLLGKAPQDMPEISSTLLPLFLPVPSAGIPAHLLENRPDIRAASSRLQSAGWNLAAGRADRLPDISFEARGVFSSDHLDLLLDNWLLSLASNLVAPVFDANLRVAEVERLKAAEDENWVVYKQVVLTAVREVEDALVTETRLMEHIERLKRVIETAGKTLDQAIVRYRNGLSDYLPVLTQVLVVQDLDRNLIDQQTSLLINRIDLYQALGGRWPADLISSEKASSK